MLTLKCAHLEGAECCVYKLANQTGEVIYIGMTGDLTARMKLHRFQTLWAAEIETVEVLLTGARDKCEQAEKSYIKELQPKYNNHSGGRVTGSRKSGECCICGDHSMLYGFGGEPLFCSRACYQAAWREQRTHG